MNVVVLGELCEDILMHNPNSVEVFEQKIWAKDVTVTAGGSAVYVSQALSRMGVDVRLCAVVGDDESGKRMPAGLAGVSGGLLHGADASKFRYHQKHRDLRRP